MGSEVQSQWSWVRHLGVKPWNDMGVTLKIIHCVIVRVIGIKKIPKVLMGSQATLDVLHFLKKNSKDE